MTEENNNIFASAGEGVSGVADASGLEYSALLYFNEIPKLVGTVLLSHPRWTHLYQYGKTSKVRKRNKRRIVDEVLKEMKRMEEPI